MKTLLVAITIVLGICQLPAQPREGKNKELSLSGGLQNTSGGNGSGSSTSFLISPRLGFFVYEGLEFEPEVVLLLASGGDPVYIANANVAYNFLASRKGTPFLLLGYGRANTIPYLNVPIARTDFGINVFNLGAGVKIFLNPDTALRLEYRFQKFFGTGETSTFGIYSFTEEVDARIQTVQFGFSILL